MAELVRQLADLGVRAGDILLVHTSFRALRPVEGGPLGLIRALREVLGPSGTVVMPSWSGDDDEPFDPATSSAAADLGVTADLFWRLPGVLRSDHVHAFAAAGPEAKAILADPLPLPPHGPLSPVGRVHEHDGKILLLGVGHDANTSLHLAELMADVPYRTPGYCTVLRHGRKQRIVVKGLADRHRSKADARLLYEDLTPAPTPEQIEMRRMERIFRAQMTPAKAPDKRQRRAIRQMKERS